MSDSIEFFIGFISGLIASIIICALSFHDLYQYKDIYNKEYKNCLNSVYHNQDCKVKGFIFNKVLKE